MKKEYKLSELFELRMGKTPSRSNSEYWEDGTYEWISIADLSKTNKYISDTKEKITENAIKESGINLIPKDTVVMSFKLSIGKTAITSKPMYSNEAIMSFIDKGIEEIIPDYLYYLFSFKDWSEGTNKAVMGKTLNKASLSEMKIKIHSVKQQREIIKLLDKVNRIIEERKNQLNLLDELVKSRFVELFGEVGTDTKGWGLKRLSDCCTINPKKGEDKRLHKDLMVSFVPMPAVSEKGEIDASETKSYDEVKTGFTYFAEQDVLFAKITPCMENGKGAVAKGLCNGIGFGSTEFHVLRPIEGVSNSYWLYVVTAFKQFRMDAASNMTGSAGQRRVPASFLDAYKISVPPIELQKQFAAFVEQTDKSKFEIQKSIEETEVLFNSLMQEFFG